MKGIIFNNIDEFNALENAIHSYLINNIVGYNGECYCCPIDALDNSGEMLLIVSDSRLDNYDFSGHSVVDINTNDSKWFINEI